jgi:Fe-S-cluster containining protein
MVEFTRMEYKRNGETYQLEDVDKLDLEKYGLSGLEGRNLVTLTDAEMDSLLTALGNDDIALNVPIPFSAENVRELLSYSECRRCGACCQPNPLNPNSPGVEAFEKELTAIAGYLRQPYEALEGKTAPGNLVPHPLEPSGLESTRWLPLPCPFYSEEKTGCTVHPVRPVVCRIYPVLFTGDDSCISVKANCEYGKDIIRRAYRILRENDPDLEIPL